MTHRTVFLSSCVKDLVEYREKAYQAIEGLNGYHAVRMEDFGAVDGQADDLCRARVGGCDLFVGILGHLYGSCPPGSEQSYTEREYQAAAEAGVPRLMFLAPDDFPVPADVIESDVARQRQRTFRQRVGSERVRDTFTSPEDLAGRVRQAIYNWASERAAGPVGRAACRSFVHAQISGSGLFDLDLLTTPYGDLGDATDTRERGQLAGAAAYIWFPETEAIHFPPVRQHFTSAAAICVPSVPGLATVRTRLSPAEVDKFARPTRKMWPEEKRQLLAAMGAALRDCFVVGVAVPELILGVGRARPDLAYQALVNLFLVPLVRKHAELQIRQFHARLADVGEQSAPLLGLTKKVVRAHYPKKDTFSADLVGDDDPCALLTNMARLYAWAVGRFHNQKEGDWLALLDGAVELKGKGPSHLAGPSPEV